MQVRLLKTVEGLSYIVRKFGSNEWWQVCERALDFDVEAIREASTPVIF